jgi:hypothetical protein
MDRQSEPRALKLDNHPARDDDELRRVCEDTAMGRWDAARDLLEATGSDWDRRIFRLQVLAFSGAGLRWVETWADAERRNPDAMVMLAHVRAVRSMLAGPGAGRELAEDAWRSCDEAARALPGDPSCWVALMGLLRTHYPNDQTLMRLWQEVRARDPYNWEAHHELLTYFFARYHGSNAQMHNLARELSAAAPRGTPIPVLLLVALAESHRLRLERESRTYGLTVHPWMDCPEIDLVLNGWWRYRSPQPHARFMDDANYLAHALCFAGRHEEGFEIFEEIGLYASRVPWGYCGDAEQLFQRHRTWATRAVGL